MDDRREVEPLLLTGSKSEPAFDSSHDQAELVVIDRVDQDRASVRTPPAGPLPEDVGEVGDVMRNENAPVLGRQRKDVLVLETLELGLLIERADVVTLAPQRSADVRPGDMGVEQEAHRRLLGDLEEGVESVKLVKRAPVRFQESLDLL